ncbi:delta-aminolevulinic acid dehydratase [Culicoides brevitarsis]|uniref:delta-aminolevulinic acid dehydratase n=1 Tax=Culicoides brevitarsis TaxID=469753 RepID=UPI00307C8E19
MSLTKLHPSLFHPTLRKMHEADVQILPHNLMYPIFLVEKDDDVQPIPSMPGVCRYGINSLKEHLAPLVDLGLSSILLFGIIDDASMKDDQATSADSFYNPVIRALPQLRKWFPNLLIACDVCLCPYSRHGHCGILHADGTIDNDKSIERIAQVAVNYAKAGAHIVAPSDMMDNRIFAIKKFLRHEQLEGKVNVLSYSVKFASSFYGPFRDAAKSKPAFGDRKCYQLPYGSRGLAKRAAKRDVEEGADMLMVKPGMPYLDIARQTKDEFPHLPLFVYQVSGEYAMIYNAAKMGSCDLRTMLTEVLAGMRRAGSDCIITYFVPQLLQWMKGGAL